MPSVPLPCWILVMSESACCTTRNRLTWFSRAAAITRAQVAAAWRRSALEARPLLRMSLSWLSLVAVSSRATAPWKVLATPAKASEVVATFWLTRSMRVVCALAKVTRRLRDRGEVLHALLHVLERGAVEGLADPLGDDADVAGDAAGLRGELADVGQGGAGPGLAAGLVGLDERVPQVGIGRAAARRERCWRSTRRTGWPTAEMTAGLRGSSTPRSMLNSVSTHSFSTSRMASTRPDLDAAQRHRRADAEAADGAEARRCRRPSSC